MILRGVPFLAAASDASIERLAALCSLRHWSRGQLLFRRDEPVEWLYVITHGRVAATTVSSRGMTLTFHVATVGETPGHVNLLNRSHSASAQALTQVSALAVPARACVELLVGEPAALLSYTRELADIVRVLNDSMADLVFLDLERRLAQVLAELPGDERDVVTLNLTQSELAARLGVARQSLNQALAKLAGRGLIVLESAKSVQIVDRARLAEFVLS